MNHTTFRRASPPPPEASRSSIDIAHCHTPPGDRRIVRPVRLQRVGQAPRHGEDVDPGPQGEELTRPAPSPPPVVHEEEIDLEGDLAALLSDVSEGELADFFENADDELERRVASAGAGVEVLDAPATVQIDPSVAEAVAEQVSTEADAAGLAMETAEAGGAASSSSSGALPSDGLVLGDAAASVAPWERLPPPTPLGYIYDGGRSIMRIQRGKPARSVTVNCYVHSRCTMLLQESRCPSDEELKKWLFSVGPPPPGASAAEVKDLAARHMALGKAKWTKKGSQAS